MPPMPAEPSAPSTDLLDPLVPVRACRWDRTMPSLNLVRTAQAVLDDSHVLVAAAVDAFGAGRLLEVLDLLAAAGAQPTAADVDPSPVPVLLLAAGDALDSLPTESRSPALLEARMALAAAAASLNPRT